MDNDKPPRTLDQIERELDAIKDWVNDLSRDLTRNYAYVGTRKLNEAYSELSLAAQAVYYERHRRGEIPS